MRVLQQWAFPLACALLSGTVCAGWASFDRRYLACVMLLAGAAALLAQWTAERRWHAAVRPGAAVSMLLLALLHGLAALFLPALAYSLAGLELLIALACFLSLWMFLPPKASGSQLLGALVLWAGMTYFLIAAAQALLLQEGAFGPDSYSYYLLSRSFPHRFGLVGTVRQYVVPGDYSMSFPYLYPLVCFLFQKVTGLSIYAGAAANLLVALFTVLVLVDVSLRCCGRAWPGQIAAALLLSCTEYQQEVNGARAIPLAVLLSLLIWCALARLFAEGDRRQALAAGALAGLLAVTRFDGLALLAFAGLAVLLCRGGRWRGLLGYAAAAAVPMAPWAVYSARHFGVLWATDNAGTAFRVETVIPTAVFLPGESVKTLFNAPGEWFGALRQKIGGVVYGLLACSPPATVLLIGTFLALGAVLLMRRRSLGGRERRTLLALGAVLFFYACKTGVYALVGYGDHRYHVETVCVTAAAVFIALEAVGMPAERPRRWAVGCMALCAAAVLATTTNARDLAFRVAYRGGSMPLAQACQPPQWVEEMKQALLERQVSPDAGVLMLTIGSGDYEFGGCCPDWKVYVQPANPTWERLEYMLDEYVPAKAIVLESGWMDDEGIEEKLDERYPARKFTVDGREYVLYELGQTPA